AASRRARPAAPRSPPAGRAFPRDCRYNPGMNHPHADPTVKTVLFLCIGNYYRSRLAELYFNVMSAARGLAWRADSRGLRLNPANPGQLPRQTVRWLADRGIIVAQPARYPLPVSEADFRAAKLIVAVKEAEHRPLLQVHFPAWAERVEYWHVHDMDC